MKIINKRIIAIITLGTVLAVSNIATAKTFAEVSSTTSSENSKLQEALKSIGIELYPAKQCMIADIKDKVDVNGTPVADCTTYYVDDYINPTVVYEWNDSSESFSQVNKNCYISLNSEPYYFVGFPKDQLIIGYKDATPDLPKDQTHIIIPILEDAWTNHCKRYNKNPLRADYYLDANDEEVYYSGYVNNYLNPTEAYSKDKNDGGLRIDSKVGNNRYNGIFSSNTLHRQQNKKGYKVLGWKDTTPNLPSNEAHKIVAITTEDFPDAKYYIGKEFFTRAYVDNLENPTKVYDNYNNKDNPIKDFANVNDSRNTSSKIEDYIPEGYIFKGWKVRGYNEKYKFTEVDAILEKDQEYIDNMQTRLDVSINADRSITMNYIDETSSSKLVSLKYSIEGIGTTYREFKEFYTSEDYKNCFITNVAYIDDLAKTNSLTYHRYFYPDDYSAHSAVGNKFIVKAEAVNDLGKVTTFEKVYDKKDLFRSVDMITTVSSPFYLDSSNLPYVEIPEEVYFGDRIYVYNLPEDVRNHKSYLESHDVHHDETGYYFIIDKMFMSSCDTENYVNKHLRIGDFDAKSFTDYYSLNVGDFFFTKALKVHNISRDGKSVAFGELPKQEEPVEENPSTETPVEPATKTPVEEEEPQQPTKTSDSSSIAVVLSILALSVVAVDKTKKKN